MIRFSSCTLLLAACVGMSSYAKSACIDQSTVTTQISAVTETKVVAQACRIGESEYPRKYKVTLSLFSRAKLMQKVEIEAEGAYQVLLDTSLDINLDGVSDIGVATGTGRAGDGMHYWVVTTHPVSLADAGEAPRLTRSTAKKKPLFALIPGSGDIQSTRIEYEFVAHALVPSQAIQFRPQTDGSYEISVLKRTSNDSATWSSICTHRVGEQEAQVCMAGGACP